MSHLAPTPSSDRPATDAATATTGTPGAPGAPGTPASAAPTTAPTVPTAPGSALTRRHVVASGAVATLAGGAAGLVGLGAPAAAARPRAARRRRIFAHGVASGDPLPTAVVLWTRVTPTPVSRPGSGKGPMVKVEWEVAKDRRFRRVVASGRVRTGPRRDHTVKVDARGLQPGRRYYYRFRLGRVTSQVGRTWTAPAAGAMPRNLRFGVVSCSNLQAGHFHAYRALARRNDLHAVIHLGDYLYEYAPGQYGYGSDDRDIRRHVPAREMVSLADYRQRHAQYKRDPDLAALHRKVPFVTTWDDHESANDAYAAGAENHQPDTEGSWRARRMAAYRAYDEWMPLRMDGTAVVGDGTRIYRRLRFGRLMELSMLDLRTYRSAPSSVPTTGGDQTITGAAQMDWLGRGLAGSSAQWKMIGNPVMVAPVDFATVPDDLVDPLNELFDGVLPPDGIAYNVDQWDGYVRDRNRLYGHIKDNNVTDVVFLTGDIHSAWACELPQDPGAYPLNSKTVGVELVCTSVTSNNLKDIVGTTALTPLVTGVLRTANPHIKYLDFDNHGYSVLDVTSARTQMDYYVTADRAGRDASSTWVRSFQTSAGSGRLTRATRPVA